MKRYYLLSIVLLVAILAACNVAPATTGQNTPTVVSNVPTTAPTTAPTATTAPVATATTPATATTASTAVPPPSTAVPPTSAPPTTAPAAARIVVQLANSSVQFLDTSGKATPVYQASGQVDLTSIFPPGNVSGSAIYLPITGRTSTVVRIDASGAHPLSPIQGPIYGLAVSSSQIAFGTGDVNATPPNSVIELAGLDLSGPKPILRETYTGIPGALRVMRWSQDGSRLFFGKEPMGIGGYILFAGLTNIWSLDPKTGKATELVHQAAPNAAVCIDDLSADEKLVADHCKITSMQVTDLATHATRAIQPPSNMPTFGAVGGARFSPDGSLLAYGLARRNPDNEQGWVAVADVSKGTSRLIATSPAGDYFSVVGWLDMNTVLLQSSGTKPGVWTVGADGSNLRRLGDGIFLGMVSGSTPQASSDCGSIQMLGPNPPRDAAALAAENCFFQAYQQHREATLKVTLSGVDAGTIHNFKLGQNNGQYGLTDTFITYVVPRPTPTPQTVTCKALVRQNGGLVFQGCGNQQDILVPAP